MTTIEAAARLGVSTARIRRLILDGRIKAVKRGREWWVTEGAVRGFERRRPGRKRKSA